MPLTVEFCSDKDFTLSLMDIIFDAFGGRSALMNAVHPENDTRAGREKAQKFLYLLSTNPGQLWLKVVESETGEIVGVSQWAVYKDEKPQLTVLTGPAMNWNTAEDQEWAQALYASLLENRLQYIGPDPGAVVCLLKMAVPPRHQRRGIGTLLMNWGMAYADDIKAECTVESTPEGRHLYEQHGFVVRRHATLAVPDKFANRPKQQLFIMQRPRVTSEGI